MQRPAGVTVIAVLFFLASAYLCGIGVIQLAAPGTISMMLGAPLMQGLELAGPYMALLVGAGWGLMSFGLFRLHRWARWAAMAVMVLGVAGGLQAVSAVAFDLNWRLAWYGAQIMLRVVVGWYLAQSPAVINAFHKHPPRVNADFRG